MVREMGDSKAVQRFLNKYGKDTTKRVYSIALALYLRWLRGKGITLSPDELVVDNLRCVYDSPATDVETKRRHMDWLDEYVNRHLVEKRQAESTRLTTASAIQQFYIRNDSVLFGDFQVSKGRTEQPHKALEAADIRCVLKALPIELRTPLLLVWQSGVEISRILSLTWEQVDGIDSGEVPLRLDLYGRKRHDKPYFTFFGRDGVEHLRITRGKWVSERGREPAPQEPVFLGKENTGIDAAWLNHRLKMAAMNLSRQGIIKSKDPRCWHSHAFRHSFRTEASHAGLKSEISEYFQGHIDGIKFVYVHSGELHPEDLAREYLKLEPYISLNQTETTLRGEYEDKERILMKRLMALEERVSHWTEESP